MEYERLKNALQVFDLGQRALEHKTPVQALKDWQKRKPELFHKKVRNHTGPDT